MQDKGCTIVLLPLNYYVMRNEKTKEMKMVKYKLELDQRYLADPLGNHDYRNVWTREYETRKEAKKAIRHYCKELGLKRTKGCWFNNNGLELTTNF